MKVYSILAALFIAVLSVNTAAAQTTEKDVVILELIQTKGQFYTQNLDLKPGKYQFRVVNKDVDKEVGFAIQKEEDKDNDVMKTAIPNSFATALIKKGESQYTGVVTLSKGTYVYSCPLNPTPHYKITVK